MSKKENVIVKLTLKEDLVEELDFLCRTRFDGVPRATLVTLLMKRALDDEMCNTSYVRTDQGLVTIDEAEEIADGFYTL